MHIYVYENQESNTMLLVGHVLIPHNYVTPYSYYVIMSHVLCPHASILVNHVHICASNIISCVCMIYSISYLYVSRWLCVYQES